MQSTGASAIPSNTLPIVMALSLVLLLAGAVAVIAGGLVWRLFRAVEGDQARAQPVAKATVRFVRFVVFAVAAVVLAFPALDFAGVDLAVGLRDEDVARWATQTGVRVAVLLLLAFGANRVASALIQRAEKEMLAGGAHHDAERRKRTATLASTLGRFAAALIWTVSLLVVLRELDVDITPILTGAGILGLAIGFGAQTLVKDIISGVFLIIEDQVRVGDVALVNGVGGLVEEINLRTIVLRDLDGTVHVIPNGEIRTLANRTKEFSYYVIDLGIDYDTDTDLAVEAVKAAGADLQADPAFGPSILEPVEVLGVDNFADSAVILKFRIKTLPLKQWEVGRELRRRVKKTLDARGIRIPFPQMEVTVKRISES